MSLLMGACKVKCNSECTKQRDWVAVRGSKNNRMCSVPDELETAMQVADSLGVRFCAVSSAEFTSCLSIREQTVTVL